MRADPDLSNLLYDWKIKYPYDIQGIKIIRSIIHPHFNRDTFADNVGLVQHNPVPKIQRYKTPKIHIDNFYNGDIEKKKMIIISWDHGSKGGKDKIEVHNVQSMAMENCTSYVVSIRELRTYEFCIVLKKKIDITLGHGAVIVDSKDFTVFGIFAWGERQQKTLPLTVLNLSHFKEWIESVTLFMDTLN
ncbi:uncharacterized protein LOC123880753 isoform X2 [Maniola jurtina]|nr:uncharacterized protein LOC123880753 isoform X2 [Maniola jurtina]